MNKSQSLPRGVTNITTSKTSEKHSFSTTLNTQIKSKFIKTSSYATSEFDGKNQAGEPKLENTKILESKREERTNSEEGFFRRFVNRSGRKHKKERENIVDTDTTDANRMNKKMESSTPAIKKSAELSIINVLSNARAKDTPIGSKPAFLPSDENDKSPKSLVMKNDKLRSGPISRQRYTKDITEIIDLIDVTPTQKSSPHSACSTSYLRFSPTKSILGQCDDERENLTRAHYHSEEMLSMNTSNGNDTVCDSNDTFNHHENEDNYKQSQYSVSLPKNAWPNESKLAHNALSRNGYSWGQCQQKISKLANDQQQSPIKTQTKGKMVEKSKSFRLYTKNEGVAQPRNDCKPSLCPSLPDLHASNRSPLARQSRYSTNRENLQSLRFSGNHLNAGTNTKWTPTRSSSSSRISEHRFGNDRFEINDMNLIPTSKLYSTLNTSDEMASYDVEKDKTHLMTDGDNVLQVSAKTHHSFQNTNINEIEDNIDKIMKSAVVTVLKKSPSTELYQFKSNNGNVSLTTITKDENHKNRLNFATIENPPLLRHSTTATKLDLQVPSSSSPPQKKIITDIPEFMQIQLNRVDGGRPKSCSITLNDNVTVSFYICKLVLSNFVKFYQFFFNYFNAIILIL